MGAIRLRLARAAPWPVTGLVSTGSLPDRLGRDPGVRLEAGNRLRRDRRTKQALNLAQQRRLVDADQRYGGATGARPRGATDAVEVVGGHHRQLVIDDVRQRLDVEAASRDLGRYEQEDATGLQVGQRADALRLRLVAVDRRGGDPVAVMNLNQMPK